MYSRAQASTNGPARGRCNGGVLPIRSRQATTLRQHCKISARYAPEARPAAPLFLDAHHKDDTAHYGCISRDTHRVSVLMFREWKTVASRSGAYNGPGIYADASETTAGYRVRCGHSNPGRNNSGQSWPAFQLPSCDNVLCLYLFGRNFFSTTSGPGY